MDFKYKLTRAAGVFSGFSVADGRYSGHAIMYSLELHRSTGRLVEW